MICCRAILIRQDLYFRISENIFCHQASTGCTMLRIGSQKFLRTDGVYASPEAKCVTEWFMRWCILWITFSRWYLNICFVFAADHSWKGNSGIYSDSCDSSVFHWSDIGGSCSCYLTSVVFGADVNCSGDSRINFNIFVCWCILIVVDSSGDLKSSGVFGVDMFCGCGLRGDFSNDAWSVSSSSVVSTVCEYQLFVIISKLVTLIVMYSGVVIYGSPDAFATIFFVVLIITVDLIIVVVFIFN